MNGEKKYSNVSATDVSNRSFAQNGGRALPTAVFSTTVDDRFFFSLNNSRAFVIAYAALPNSCRYRRVSVKGAIGIYCKKKNKLVWLLPRSDDGGHTSGDRLDHRPRGTYGRPWTTFDFPLTVAWNVTRPGQTAFKRQMPIPCRVLGVSPTVYVRIEFVICNIPGGIHGLLPFYARNISLCVELK